MQLTSEQQAIVDRFSEVLHGRRKRLVMGGLAGTGKTTVIDAIVQHYGPEDVVVCTPTGKAAHVLRSKGVEHACTIHSLIYHPRFTKGELSFSLNSSNRIPVAIIDEASMLSTQLVTDITKKIGAVMYVGDHGQLEPVGDDPGLMQNLDIRLEQIHRQAAGSPIIQFAHHVRQGGEPQSFGPQAFVQSGGSEDLASFDVIVCGFNSTRVRVNAWVRKRRGYSGKLPEVGEQIICLRNDKDAQVWNGMTGTVRQINVAQSLLSVDTDDGPRTDLRFDPRQFGTERTLPYESNRQRKREGRPPSPTLWDFGYCLTAHKIQGSEYPRVAVKEEIAPTWSAERWRYTAATRASQELRWVL